MVVLGLGGNSGVGEIGGDFGCILRVELLGCVDQLEVSLRNRGVKNDFMVFIQSNWEDGIVVG